jgi:hypothetical protein
MVYAKGPPYMSTQTATTPTPVPAKRRRWWLRGMLIFLALLTLAPVGFFGYLRYTTSVAWDAAEAEADRLDPDWRMTPLFLKRRVVPDEENSALHIIAVAGKAKNFAVASAPNYDLIFERLPANARLNGQQLALIRGELDKIRGPLEEARQLKDFPYGRFPIKIAPVFFMTAFPDHYRATALGEWLKHDAYERAHEDQIDLAVQSCRGSLCAARSVGDEPFVVSHMLRMAVQREAIVALERSLAQGEAAEPALQETQALLDLEIKESDWLHALRGERAGAHAILDDIRTGNAPASTLDLFTPIGKAPGFVDWLADSFSSALLRQYPEHLRHMTRAIEIAKLPLHDQRPKIQAWDQATRASPNRIIGAFAPSIGIVFSSHCRSQALLRCAMTAVACERYRLEHEAWPRSLDVLVEKKLLAAVPLDPIDGKPLRYRNENGLITIYSIGNDEKDDGGTIVREQGDTPGVDIGFRLWATDQRGAAPLPPVRLPAP